MAATSKRGAAKFLKRRATGEDDEGDAHAIDAGFGSTFWKAGVR